MKIELTGDEAIRAAKLNVAMREAPKPRFEDFGCAVQGSLAGVPQRGWIVPYMTKPLNPWEAATRGA